MKSAREIRQIVYDKCGSTLQLKQITHTHTHVHKRQQQQEILMVVFCLKCPVFKITINQLFSQEPSEGFIIYIQILESLPPSSAISLLPSCVEVFVQVNVDLLVIQIYDLLSPCYLLFPVKYNLILK